MLWKDKHVLIGQRLDLYVILIAYLLETCLRDQFWMKICEVSLRAESPLRLDQHDCEISRIYWCFGDLCLVWGVHTRGKALRIVSQAEVEEDLRSVTEENLYKETLTASVYHEKSEK